MCLYVQWCVYMNVYGGIYEFSLWWPIPHDVVGQTTLPNFGFLVSNSNGQAPPTHLGACSGSWFVHITCARAAVARHDSYTSEQIKTSSATRFPMCSYLGDQLDNVQCARWSDITRRGEARGLWWVNPLVVRLFLEHPPGIVGGSQEVDEVDKHSNSPAQFIAMLGDRFHASTGTWHWKIRIISQRAVIISHSSI